MRTRTVQKLRFVSTLTIFGFYTGVEFIVRLYLSLFYRPQCGLFVTLQGEESAQQVFRSFAEVIVSYIAIESLHSWREVSSGSSYVTILNHVP